jgi:hypothetical protein
MARPRRILLALGVLLSAGCSPAPSERTGEPPVQLSLGTQTGGSGEQRFCGDPEVWTATDDEPPFIGSFEGPVQLQGWRIACEVACAASECDSLCASDCARTTVPPGNVRHARVELFATGPVQRNTNQNEAGEPLCDELRHVDVEWRIELERTLVATTKARMHYSLDEPGAAVWSNELDIEELDASAHMATVEDFQALGEPKTPPADSRGVYFTGSLMLAEDAAEVLLRWECADCANRIGIELAQGVVRRAGAAPPRFDQPPKVSAPTWRWPEAACHVE